MQGRYNMKIITLIENTCERKGCIPEHGLSIYAETCKHRLLLDAGQTDALINNAEVLNVDLTKVDTVVLSHGHYDHSGGIIPFSYINPNASVYIHRKASEPHYHDERYIGIDQHISGLSQTIFTDESTEIDDELFLFSNIKGRRLYPQGNRKLSKIENGQRYEDDFAHEQCLVITQNDRRTLLSGCAHNGILNILDRYYEIFGNTPYAVLSGFHMMKKDTDYTDEEKTVITQTAAELSKMNTMFFSGHCTGLPAFNMMKEIMGDQLQSLSTGKEINIL